MGREPMLRTQDPHLRVALVGKISPLEVAAIEQHGGSVVPRGRTATRRTLDAHRLRSARSKKHVDAVDVPMSARTRDRSRTSSSLQRRSGAGVVLHDLRPETSDEDLMSVERLAVAAGVIVAVPFVQRYYPMVRLARRRVRSGRPGPLHLIHGWTLWDPAAWWDLAEFASGTPCSASSPPAWQRRSATCPTALPAFPARPPSPSRPTAAPSARWRSARRDPCGGGTFVLALEGVEEIRAIRRSTPRDPGRRRTPRRPNACNEASGSDVSRYSTQPPGRPQGHRDCWDAFVLDAHAAIAGTHPDGLPTLTDLLRTRAIARAVRESEEARAWVGRRGLTTSTTQPWKDIRHDTGSTGAAAERGSRRRPSGYEVDLHLAWYRSLPLSCIEGIDLTIDGMPLHARSAPRPGRRTGLRSRRPGRAGRHVVVRAGRADRSRPVSRQARPAGRRGRRRRHARHADPLHHHRSRHRAGAADPRRQEEVVVQ